VADHGHVLENGRAAVETDARIPITDPRAIEFVFCYGGFIRSPPDSVQHRRFTRIPITPGFT